MDRKGERGQKKTKQTHNVKNNWIKVQKPVFPKMWVYSPPEREPLISNDNKSECTLNNMNTQKHLNANHESVVNPWGDWNSRLGLLISSYSARWRCCRRGDIINDGTCLLTHSAPLNSCLPRKTRSITLMYPQLSVSWVRFMFLHLFSMRTDVCAWTRLCVRVTQWK